MLLLDITHHGFKCLAMHIRLHIFIQYAVCRALEQDDLPDLKQLLGNLEGISSDIRKAGYNLIDFF